MLSLYICIFDEFNELILIFLQKYIINKFINNYANSRMHIF